MPEELITVKTLLVNCRLLPGATALVPLAVALLPNPILKFDSAIVAGGAVADPAVSNKIASG